MKSIEHVLKTRDYARLRIGVGPPSDRQITGDLADFVLAPFGKMEREEIMSLMPSLTDVCEIWAKGDIDAAMRLNN